MTVVLPELTLLAHLEVCLSKLRNDLALHHAEPEKTWLYRVFGELKIDAYRYFDEAHALLLQLTPGQGPFTITLGFPEQTAGMPAVALLLPGEDTGKTNAIGMNPELAEADDDDYYAPGLAAAAGSNGALGRSFSATYNLMIIAHTSQQTVMIYHLLRALLIGSMPQLAGKLALPELRGRDVNIDPETGPYPGMAMRQLSISFSYESRVPALFDDVPVLPIGRFLGHPA